METQGHRPRLIIADDHEAVAEACFNQLEPEFEVVAMVSDGWELLRSINRLHPDLVILDIAMPNLNGLLAAEKIKAIQPAVKLVFLTMSVSAEMAEEAFRRGASGYVVKHGMASELVDAVRRVLRGEFFLSPIITKRKVGFLPTVGATLKGKTQTVSRLVQILWRW